MNTVITLPRAVELVTEAVELRGRDFVYMPGGSLASAVNCFYSPRPDYFPEDHPAATSGCLIGTALELAGCAINDDLVVAADGLNSGGFLPSGFQITEAAGRFFRECQTKQDAGDTWGDSLAHGLERLEYIASEYGDE